MESDGVGRYASFDFGSSPPRGRSRRELQFSAEVQKLPATDLHGAYVYPEVGIAVDLT